jgi:hypothetical protein
MQVVQDSGTTPRSETVASCSTSFEKSPHLMMLQIGTAAGTAAVSKNIQPCTPSNKKAKLPYQRHTRATIAGNNATAQQGLAGKEWMNATAASLRLPNVGQKNHISDQLAHNCIQHALMTKFASSGLLHSHAHAATAVLITTGGLSLMASLLSDNAFVQLFEKLANDEQHMPQVLAAFSMRMRHTVMTFFRRTLPPFK